MKELESLERIIKSATSYAVFHSKKDVRLVRETITDYVRLMKKEEPMKPILTQYKKVVGSPDGFYIGNQYSCDKCKSILFRDRWAKVSNELHLFYDLPKHCPSCGQKLDWSDEELNILLDISLSRGCL